MKVLCIFISIFFYQSAYAQILQEHRQNSWELGIAMKITLTCGWRSSADKSKIEKNFKNFSKKVYSKSSQRSEMFDYYLKGIDSAKVITYDKCSGGVDKNKFVNKTKRALNQSFW